MSERPLVSVVIPTYNRGALLRRSVESVCAQTYPNIELLVVDDHSDPPANETIEPLPLDTLANYQCIRHEENRGVCVARNTGIDAANGVFVAFLDDDDEWAPSKIEKQVSAFREGGDDVGLVYTGVEQRTHEDAVIGTKTPTIEGDVLKELLFGNFVGTYSVVMIRAEAIESVGSLDERYPSWHDWEHYLRIAREWEFKAVPERLVTRYSGHEQNSDSYRTRRDVDSKLLIEEYGDRAAEFGPLAERRFEASVAFSLGRSAYSNRLYGEARKRVVASIRQYPANPTAYLYLLLLLGGRYTFGPALTVKRKLTDVRFG